MFNFNFIKDKAEYLYPEEKHKEYIINKKTNMRLSHIFLFDTSLLPEKQKDKILKQFLIELKHNSELRYALEKIRKVFIWGLDKNLIDVTFAIKLSKPDSEWLCEDDLRAFKITIYFWISKIEGKEALMLDFERYFEKFYSDKMKEIEQEYFRDKFYQFLSDFGFKIY